MKYNKYSFLDLLSNIVDNRGKTCPTSEEGIPLIATNCIKNDSLYPVFQKIRHVSQETYDSWFRGHPKEGDLIFVTKGSPGRVCWVDDPKRFCIAQDMVAIRANKKLIDPKYLLALLRDKKSQSKISNMHVGTLIPHFKKGDFDKLFFEIPDDLDFQKKIGDIYFNIALKVENNKTTNVIVESISQAIFKSWFINFDPVQAKIEALKKGLDPELAAMEVISGKSKEELQLLSEKSYQNLIVTASLFPNEFEETEYGQIPRGWKYSKLLELSSFLSRGMTPKYVDEEEGVMVINQRCIRDHTINFSNVRFHNEELKAIKSKEVFIGDILINSTGVGTLGRVAQVKRLLQKTTVDTHVTIVRADSQKVNPNYLAQYLLSNESVIEEMGEGSTGQTELKRTVLNEMVICKPDLEIQNQFSNVIRPMIESIGIRELKNERLLSIRDVLIPKLLNNSLNFSE